MEKFSVFSLNEVQTSSSSCPSQDALQELYNKEGKFPGPTVIPSRRPWTLLNFLFWATLLLSPLINFACGVAISGSPLLIIGFIIFLIIGRELCTSDAGDSGSQ